MQKQTICLNMIVKNEGHIIGKTLSDLMKYIKFDYWVICDTGSTDDTRQIIIKFFDTAGISGELINSEWKDFGHNRTVALAHAYKKTDYVFIWDADDEIVGDFKLPQTLDEDAYIFQFGGICYFRRIQMVKNSIVWKYIGVLHEYITSTESTRTHFFVNGNYHFISGRRGSRNKNPNKYRDDAVLLEEAYAEAVIKDDPIQARYAFYVANSYKDANMTEKAIEYYQKVLYLKGWDQEKYVSCLELYELLKCTNLALGLYYLIESRRFDKIRIECVYRLVKHYSSKGMYDVAYMYYTLIKNIFESRNNYLARETLFLRKGDYIFNMPIIMIPICVNMKEQNSLLTMYEIILNNKTVGNNHHSQQFFNNLVHIIDNIEYSEKTINTLYSIIEYIEKIYENESSLNNYHFSIIDTLIEKFKKVLVAEISTKPTTKCKNPKIIFTILCNNLSAFTQTMNSILNTWTDIEKIDYFFCIVENLPDLDMKILCKTYPFFDFYMKTESETGLKESMNIIWKKLALLNPTYWVHMIGQWLFLGRDKYVEKSVNFLNEYKEQNVHQILFNRNYAQILEHYNYQGGKLLKKGFKIHEMCDDLKGANCGKWPNYSFIPSMTLVKTILKLGNYDSSSKFFESEYAKKYTKMGLKSAFFDSIRCLNIEFMDDKKQSNPYTFEQTPDFIPNKYVIRFDDTGENTNNKIALLDKNNITDYEIFNAFNKTSLTQEIKHLFRRNNFGNKKTHICYALSHYTLWKKLSEDKHNKYYVIFEDGFSCCDNFGVKFKETVSQIEQTTADIIFLGFSSDMQALTYVDGIRFCELDKKSNDCSLFGYVITKKGAERLLTYINIHGIKQQLNSLIKTAQHLKYLTIQPQIVYLERAKYTESNDVFDFSLTINTNDEWIFVPNKDSMYNDLLHEPEKLVPDLKIIANATKQCVAFNTLGYFKSDIVFPLVNPQLLRGSGHGIYIKRSFLEERNRELYGEDADKDFINLIYS